MSCPYFEPLEPRSRATDPRFAMLPLGDSWAGICRADPLSPSAPDESALHTLCNLGYARHSCSRFPPGSGPDAVRFAVCGDSGAAIQVRWAVERDHHPFAHGSFDFLRSTGAFTPEPPTPAILGQAHAYVSSYLRRTRVEE